LVQTTKERERKETNDDHNTEPTHMDACYSTYNVKEWMREL